MEIFRSSHPDQRDLKRVLSNIPRKVSPEMNQRLQAPYTREEIEMAIKSFPPTKASGPDGFPALFYHKYWDIVRGKTVDDCLAILNQSELARGWNHTNIALIPKSCQARLVSDYRPIRLCNVSYKIVTKVIANRLKFVLNDIIDECQSAFIPGWSISDNMIIGHEILHFLNHNRKRKKGFAALKLDMSKAYDHVEWSYLGQVLYKLGFHGEWINLIMDCISTASFSILINGEAVGNFKPSRGLRQGDPYLHICSCYVRKVFLVC